MRQKIIIILILTAILGAGFYFFTKQDTKISKLDPPQEKMIEQKQEMTEVKYQFRGKLKDVTLGKTTTGINTDNKATGIAQSKFKNSSYNLLATFEGLPDPQGSNFYEGWIVRREPKFSVKSTGRAEKKDGIYQNTFTADEDLTDHDFYVLTIEPDDGDPAPAEHILEGVMGE